LKNENGKREGKKEMLKALQANSIQLRHFESSPK
jgi:hypothetical protein